MLASADRPPLWHLVYVRGRLAYQGPGPCPSELVTAGDDPPPPDGP